MARELEVGATIMITEFNNSIVLSVDQMLTILSRSSSSTSTTRGAGAADTVTRKKKF